MNKLVEMHESNLAEWVNDPTVLTDGLIIICRRGSVVLNVNFDTWSLHQDSVIILFPNDVVNISESSQDFLVEFLRYDSSVLREASFKIEQTVYDHLRHDRCRTGNPIVVDIINSMFALLKVYFRQPECTTLQDITLLQLKSFFLGFYDYVYRFPLAVNRDKASSRMHEIFGRFMQCLEERFRESRDVQYYADLLNITPKYLGIIVRQITGHTAKTVISHYVMLQMKHALRDTNQTVQQLSYEFHFDDPAFLCRFFKSHTGQTPQGYRNQLRGK